MMLIRKQVGPGALVKAELFSEVKKKKKVAQKWVSAELIGRASNYVF